MMASASRHAPRLFASISAAALVYTVSRTTLHADTNADQPPPASTSRPKLALGNRSRASQNNSLLVWGYNHNNLLDSESPDIIKQPSGSSLFPANAALRSISLHQNHAACIDARGDLYQWGPAVSPTPKKTLAGKDISYVATTASKVIALSKSSGKIYVIPTNEDASQSTNTVQSSRWWWWSSLSASDVVELAPESPLQRGEKFQSIAAGRDHLLALTSNGRTFSLPLSLNANSHGQLGVRTAILTSSASGTVTQNLDPVSEADPFSQSTPFKRMAKDDEGQLVFVPIRNDANELRPINSQPSMSSILEETSPRFSTTLKEIPSLQGLRVAQIATGGRTSYARTGGRVLAWGANEHGQLGLGATLTLPYVTAPSEVMLSRNAPSSMAQCSSIAAAGDVAYFAVKRLNPRGEHVATDVIACGNGQWGGLGNGVFSSSQGEPTRIRALSGLTEFSEKQQRMTPIDVHDMSASPTGHAMLTLDTASQAVEGSAAGRDLYVWGSNRTYELGDGRKSSQAVPRNIFVANEQRMMLAEKVMDVADLEGKLWKKSTKAEQAIATGYGCSMVYWRVKE